MVYRTNTIAAISTAYGRGGIAVIRVSGDEAVEIADRCFRASNGKSLTMQEHGQCVYGRIIKNGVQIDDGMCTVFRAPKSYTGEDVVEISCHGGILLTQKVLEALFECGAVQATAGEFTRRAFTNGKLSLSQAEAVGMLIDAQSEEQLSLAISHERGVVRDKADELYERLKTVVTGMYANVDFPDEDLAELSDDEVLAELSLIEGELSGLKASYRVGRAVCEGIRAVIVGTPNVGKSSLLNLLVGSDRAIVTDVAGTTRDTIEETVSCGRVLLRLCDTAGIHETSDIVEQIGVRRSLEMLERAELVLAVFDSSEALDNEDLELLEKLKALPCVKIAILNKCDLNERLDVEFLRSSGAFCEIINICSLRGSESGIDRFIKTVEELYIKGEIDYNSQAVLTNARQNASVSRALDAVRNAMLHLRSGLSTDMYGFDIETALSELGELDGRKVSEEIVDGIFHRFCVGK